MVEQYLWNSSGGTVGVEHEIVEQRWGNSGGGTVMVLQ